MTAVSAKDTTASVYYVSLIHFVNIVLSERIESKYVLRLRLQLGIKKIVLVLKIIKIPDDFCPLETRKKFKQRIRPINLLNLFMITLTMNTFLLRTQ